MAVAYLAQPPQLVGIVPDQLQQAVQGPVQRAFRILVGFEGGGIMGELVSPEPGFLIDYQPFQLIQLGGDAIGVIDAPLLPQRALESARPAPGRGAAAGPGAAAR